MYRKSSMPTQIRIAVADDHELLLPGFVSVIEQAGFEVCVQAVNGKCLIEQIDCLSLPPDISLLDISMPVMNGFDTAREIKKRWPEMGILAVTSLFDEMAVVKMIASGAHGYLLKRAKMDELRNAIFSIYEHKVYYSEMMDRKLFKSIKNKEIKPAKLSEWETEVLSYFTTDLSYEAIADELGVTRRSVVSAKERLFEKFNVHSRASLVVIALNLGYVSMDLLAERNY